MKNWYSFHDGHIFTLVREHMPNNIHVQTFYQKPYKSLQTSKHDTNLEHLKDQKPPLHYPWWLKFVINPL